MKKIVSVTILALVMLLSSCSLANESGTFVFNQYYYPIYMVFETDGEDSDDDLFSWSWTCDESNPTLDSTCMSYGQGFYVNKQSTNTSVFDDNGKVTTTTTISMETTVYFADEQQELVFYPVTYFLTQSGGNIYDIRSTGLALQNGITVNQTTSYPMSEDETIVISFSIHAQQIDTLLSVEIQEFNDEDELIKTSVINQIDLVDTITLIEDTAYVIVKEIYQNTEEETYNVRTMFDKSSSAYFNLKFLDIDGFAHSHSLHLVF